MADDRSGIQVEIRVPSRAHENVSKFVDKLLANPDAFTNVSVHGYWLTDEVGAKMAQFVTVSKTVARLDLTSNRFGAKTYLAIAGALRVNTSLRELHMHTNKKVDRELVDTAFVEALRVNPTRPHDSVWQLYFPSHSDLDYERLKK